MSAVAARVVSAVVTLHARVWIEILYFNYMPEMDEVTLHARVWIEIGWCQRGCLCCLGHPPREGVD